MRYAVQCLHPCGVWFEQIAHPVPLLLRSIPLMFYQLGLSGRIAERILCI